MWAKSTLNLQMRADLGEALVRDGNGWMMRGVGLILKREFAKLLRVSRHVKSVVGQIVALHYFGNRLGSGLAWNQMTKVFVESRGSGQGGGSFSRIDERLQWWSCSRQGWLWLYLCGPGGYPRIPRQQHQCVSEMPASYIFIVERTG